MATPIEVDVKALLAAGAHFGHKTSRWHPAMRQYIHSKRGDSHVIDLIKTAEKLEEALVAVQTAVAGGGKILVVSTKRQLSDVIKQLSDETSMPFVVNRWPGGLLTNQKTVGDRVKHLKDLERRMESGELAAKYSKLEVQRFQDEIDEMNWLYGGIKEMPTKPAMVFVADIVHDKNAVREANTLRIPVVGIADTNADPRDVTYPIPCNDDAIKAVALVCDYIRQAIEAGRAKNSKSTDEPNTVTKKSEEAVHTTQEATNKKGE
jgi:small subunit ribosomal protein S2